MPDPVAKPVLEDISARLQMVRFNKDMYIGKWSGVTQCRNTVPDASVSKTHLQIMSCRAITAGLLLLLRKDGIEVDFFAPFDSIAGLELEPQAEFDARIAAEAAAKKAATK